MYLNCLPVDLLSPLFLYFQPVELHELLPKIRNLIPKLFSCKVFWQELCHRDISSIIPTIESCEKYIEEISKFLNHNDKDESYIQYLVINNYDILLRPNLVEYHKREQASEIAAFNGSRQLLDILLKMYPELFREALIGAAGGGHIDIVREMLEMSKKFGGIDENIEEYEEAAHNAAEHNHENIIDLLINAGVSDYDGVMGRAARSGHRHIVDKMLKLGAASYNWTMINALQGGNVDIAQLMVDRGANGFRVAAPYVGRESHIRSLDYILRFIDEKDIDYPDLIVRAIYGKSKNYKNFIELCLAKCVRLNINPEYENMMFAAVDTKDADIVEYVIQKVNKSDMCYSRVIERVLNYGYIAKIDNTDILEVLLKNSPDNMNYDKYIVEFGPDQQSKTMKLLISYRDKRNDRSKEK